MLAILERPVLSRAGGFSAYSFAVSGSDLAVPAIPLDTPLSPGSIAPSNGMLTVLASNCILDDWLALLHLAGKGMVISE